MKIFALVKNLPFNPCPLAAKRGMDDDEIAAWKKLAGQRVTLLGTVPEHQVVPGFLCGSDTYWNVEPSSLIKEAGTLVGDGPEQFQYYVFCRHILDIGD